MTRGRFGLWPATRLMLRRHRVALVAWTLSLLLLVGITVPSYQTTYPGLEERGPLVQQMQNTDGMRLIYGIMHGPGRLGQLFVWEVGAYAILLTCIMALLLAVSCTRGEEDAGTLELVRASGVRTVTPLIAGMVLVFTACLLVGGGSAAILLAQMASTSELTTQGALAFGGVTALSGCTVGLVAMVFAQLRGEARGARAWSFLFVGVTFLLRILADEAISNDDWPRWLRTLNWFSPFGWKEVVSPYTEDRMWPLLVFVVVDVVLVMAAVGLYSAREYSRSVLPDSSASSRRLHVPGVEVWTWIDARSQMVGWSVAILVVAALFGSMTGGLVETLRDSEPTRKMLEQMSASSGTVPGASSEDLAKAAEALSPESLLGQFYEFLGLYVALLVAIFAVFVVLKWRGEEKVGHLDLELTAGTRHWRSLLARCLWAVVASVAVLAAASALMGWLGEMQMAEEVGAGKSFELSMTSTFGQVPAVVAGIGVVAVLIAVVPRLSGAIWAVIAGSMFLQMFGGLVDLPGWLRDLSLYAWAPSVGETWHWPQMVLLTGIGVLGMAVAAASVGRRDVKS